ncbi:MAG: Xaa-Pro peptidase family protein [Candidatus Aminicenantes bacterium]|nr:Xaa-Pro peptidase family protein [Candidatus Aminicenantes bacterium]
MISRRHFLKIGGLTASLSGFASDLFSQSNSALPQAALENLVAGVKPLGPEDYDARLERARALMADHKIDGLFLPGGTDLAYFTTVSWGTSERTFGALLNRKGGTVWVCPAFEKERAKELIPEGQEIRIWEEHESPFKLIGGIMSDLGVRSGRLGIGPSTAAFIFYGIRQDAPSLDLVHGAAVTESCRGTKTAKEIASMDLANKITKLAYREGFKSIREGMTPRDLSSAIGAAHQKLGASGSGGPQFGSSTAFPHGSRAPRTLKPGDVIMVDGGCRVQGYSSDVTRTIVFGKPSDKMAKVWDIVRKAQAAALKTARPGATCESVDAAARKVVEDAGYGPGYKYFAHRVGHGIGMDGHEYPYLVKGNMLKLEPGMTFSNEPGIYIYGEFGIRTEDCMVVTGDGARHLGGMEAVSIEQPFS